MKIKNIQLGVTVLFLLTLLMTSCSKSFSRGTINRDCTGTYLMLNNKDYLICNPSIADSYENDSSIKVKFKSKTSCSSNSTGMICALYHKNYGLVEITEIK